jgi:hypothetical protein
MTLRMVGFVVARLRLFLIFCLFASPAFAQSPYVSAAVGLDVQRSDRFEAQGGNDTSGDGEAIAFSIRVGTAVGDRWGVELGFTRPSTIERESSYGYPIPLLAALTATTTAANVPSSLIAPLPIFESSTRIERRNTTLDAVAWVSQPVGARVELVYLGGLAFSRVVEDLDFQFVRRIATIVVPNSTRTITYGVGPVAGLEGRISLTDHVRLVPGVRLLTIAGSGSDGWLLRATTGLAWHF